MNSFKKSRRLFLISFIIICFASVQVPFADGLNIPTAHYGISFGNSKYFNGLRINFSDRNVKQINGINITLWRALHNQQAKVRGISIGLIAPDAGSLRGINIGGLGVAGDQEVCGFSAGLLGVGSGGRVRGIAMGGLGVGAGGSITGIVFGGLGAGAEGNVKGVGVGGLGVGSNGNVAGIMIGGLGAGAQGNFTGIGIGGLGVGAGGDMTGILFGGLGAGCSGNLNGVALGGLGVGASGNFNGLGAGLVGVGAGGNMTGLFIGGVGVGAKGLMRGVFSGGLGIRSENGEGLFLSLLQNKMQVFKGMTIAAGMNDILPDGRFSGFAAGAFNRVRGRQTGISIGILNIARELKGLQIGLINYAGDNPPGLKVLPVVNF
ncbi:MAG: hypothetical protein WAN36_12245 [Calditrichia bacterium]